MERLFVNRIFKVEPKNKMKWSCPIAAKEEREGMGMNKDRAPHVKINVNHNFFRALSIIYANKKLV